MQDVQYPQTRSPLCCGFFRLGQSYGICRRELPQQIDNAVGADGVVPIAGESHGVGCSAGGAIGGALVYFPALQLLAAGGIPKLDHACGTAGE